MFRTLVISAALLGAMTSAQDAVASSKSLRGSSGSPNSTQAAVYLGEQEVGKLLGDFFASGDSGQHPEGFRNEGGNRFSLTVKPYAEAVRVSSPRFYSGGRFEFRCKTASQMPGIITAVYMSTGQGRTGDWNNGNNDEIDLEWKGNSPNEVQTNVYVGGSDAPQVTYLGFNSADGEATYAIEWGPNDVQFFVNGGVVRSMGLPRSLRPMQLQLAVWTTTGGWSGLQQWAGPTNWGSRGNAPVTAEFEILSVPN